MIKSQQIWEFKQLLCRHLVKFDIIFNKEKGLYFNHIITFNNFFMTPENDANLSLLTIKLKNTSNKTVGTGVIYYSDNLGDKVYILTAAHCLYEDSDDFAKARDQINIDILNPRTNSYETLLHTIDHNFVNPIKDKDVAILIVDKSEVISIVNNIPKVFAAKERQGITSFVVKGFPNATKGKELACIYPTWSQNMTEVNKFQLNLIEDYNSWTTMGFSGSGVFLNSNNDIYFYGIFTRFRAEDKGKIIYCQFLETINEVLDKNFAPNISFIFLGEHGLNPSFFKNQVKKAISNLGPRFNEELNFRLPIARRFNDIAKDSVFKRRLLKYIDEWVFSRRGYTLGIENVIYKQIEPEVSALYKETVEWARLINWSPDHFIDINPILSKIDLLDETIRNKLEEVFKLQSEEWNKKGEKEKTGYHHEMPYEREINYLKNVLSTNSGFISSLENVNVILSNYPYLIIQGEAGCGKSHLLGDIANERIKNGEATILLLGQLFKTGQTIWPSIFNQLNLSCTKDEFLEDLNNIGRQQGSRVLILIDALNEGAGKELWYNELSGFVYELMKYPFIGFVTTVRTTYWDAVIPDQVKTDSKVTKFVHEGFRGNEYAALRLFSEHYELQQPSFPILAPEFTNPLFLQVICQGVKASGSDTFPQGFQGFSSIFAYYLKAINKKLNEKRDEYHLKPKLAQQAIYELASACFDQEEGRALPLNLAVELFENKFPKHQYLLADLIHENVFTQNLRRNYKTSEEEDVIYFAYERFGDFFIAEKLLKPYSNQKEVKATFKKGNILGKLLEDSYWRNSGIVEVLSAILPEKYNLEIVEVFDWVFKEKTDQIPSNLDDRLNIFLMDSLKWRTIRSINDKKLTVWVRSKNFRMHDDEYFYRLIELTSTIGHPFNSDRLHRILSNTPMAERDSFWQQHLYYYSTKDDDGNAHPIVRLIDWAWQPDISKSLNHEVARLTAQTLSWVLCTTNRGLRDRATKALVNLLEEQPKALVAILNSFKDVDDFYISERLYAVAYGCALRTASHESLKLISQYVFSHIFKNGSPPVHVLLRDYARNIVEYAIYKKIEIDGDIKLIRPPYKSKIPDKWPSDLDINKFKMDYNSPDYKKNNGPAYNNIFYSVMDSDFGRYIIDSSVEHFSSTSFTFEKEYRDFLRKLSKTQKDDLKLFSKLSEWVHMTENHKNNVIRNIGEENYKKDELLFTKLYKNRQKILLTAFTKEQKFFFTNKIIPHFIAVQRAKDSYSNYFDSDLIRRWIVKRAFELGYDALAHGNYDTNIRHFNNRSENKIERIGKKYQWIAYHEIIAMLCDNYKIKDRWGNDRELHYYQGAWQLYLRNIDPVFVTKKNERDPDDEEDEEDLTKDPNASGWWVDNDYNYWNQPSAQWALNTKDLPDPSTVIQRRDENGTEWLYLNIDLEWREPKVVGNDPYKSQRKTIWYMIQGYIVKKSDKSKITKWLKKQSFWGRWLPESNKPGSRLFTRENYWSPAAKSQQKGRVMWEYLENSNYKVIVTTSEAVGEMSSDKSGAHFPFDMPCQTIFEDMKLQYAAKDGEFKNSKEDLIVTSVNPKGILIKKKDFIEYLDKKGYDIIWTVLGEKQAFSGMHHTKENYFSRISGVYAFETEKIKGTLKIFEDE